MPLSTLMTFLRHSPLRPRFEQRAPLGRQARISAPPAGQTLTSKPGPHALFRPRQIPMSIFQPTTHETASCRPSRCSTLLSAWSVSEWLERPWFKLRTPSAPQGFGLAKPQTEHFDRSRTPLCSSSNTSIIRLLNCRDVLRVAENLNDRVSRPPRRLSLSELMIVGSSDLTRHQRGLANRLGFGCTKSMDAAATSAGLYRSCISHRSELAVNYAKVISSPDGSVF